jgi:ClpP class serine protease
MPMEPLSLLWLVFLALALAPMLRQRMLEVARARALARLQRSRGSRAILLVHRQETVRLLGVPLVRYIDMDDSEAVLRAIHLTDPDVPLDLILHTPGGMVLAALQIARALKAHPGRVTVFVPHFAMSGGTLIALAADEIVLSPHAVLGPVDPQVGGRPAASLLRVIEQKPIAEVDDDTLVMADVARKAVDQVTAAVRELLAGTVDEPRAVELATLLAQGAWTHDHPITAAEARAFGLPVSTEMPAAVIELMGLYPQGMRPQGAVEYLPGRRRRTPAPG